MSKYYTFHTLGCKLNFAESSALAADLHALGYQKASRGQVVDLCVVNTCSVTDAADQKDRQAIRRIHREHPEARVVVTGCYAQLKPQEVANIEGVDLVLGANEKGRLIEWLKKGEDEECEKENSVESEKGEIVTDVRDAMTRRAEMLEFHGACSEEGRTRHFLKVQDGCDYFCTYCTIPMARGRSRNTTIEETVRMAREALQKGAREIVLTGVNIGDFGKSTGENFVDLVKALDAIEIAGWDNQFRYRISSIEPNLLTDEILNFVAGSKHFAPHFHIPLQSGSDEVLHLMKRRYNRDFFASKIARVHELMPNAFIGVDVMVGVRGETPEAFEDMRGFLEQLEVSQLHVFTYSERQGTRMLQIDYVVPAKERKRRSDVLHELSERKLRAFYEKHKGEKAMVLWEEGTKGDEQLMHGFTENYIRLSRPYDERLINCFTEETI